MRALIIEDDAEMAGLVKKLLRTKFEMNSEIAPDCASARRMMTSRQYDVITLDYRLPDGAGLDLLDEITEKLEHPPVIMVTGHGDEETAARSFRSRASGYVVKGSLLPANLADAVEEVLSEVSLKRVEKELLDEKTFIEDSLNSLPDLFVVLDIEGNLFRWNRRLGEVTGYGDTELASMNVLDLFAPEEADVLTSSLAKMKGGGVAALDELTLLTRTGEKKPCELSGQVLRNRDGVPIGFCGIGRLAGGRGGARDDQDPRRDKLEEIVEEPMSELAYAYARLQQEAAELELAREALRASTEQLRTVFENSMDIIAIFDSRGTFLDSNSASEHVLGYTLDEFMGKTIFDMVHPDDQAALLETHRQVASGGEPVGVLECRFLHEDGSWRTLEAAAKSFTDAAGELRVVVNARDITRRRKAEAETKQFKTIADNANYGIGMSNMDYELIYINPYMARVHGYEPEELLGQNLILLHDTEEQAEGLLALADELSTEGSFSAREVWHLHKDGSVFPMLMNGVLITSNEVDDAYVAVTAIDITDRIRAEEQLREREQQLGMITDNMEDVIALIDVNGAYQYVSPSYGRLLGYDPAEALGRSAFEFLDLVHPDDIEVYMESLAEVLRVFEPARVTYRLRHADGHYLWLESVGVPLTDDGGMLTGAVIASRDITESKLADDALWRLNSELEGYARTVSHDLQSPLTAIKLASDTLTRLWEKRDEVSDIGAEIRRIAEIIGLSVVQAKELIKDLLALAMAGREPEDISEVDVSATVARIIEERAALIQDRNAVVRVAGDLGKVRANQTHVYQLFSNFIDNAIKHNHDRDPVVEISYLGCGPDGHAYVVKDNGPGIAPEDALDIFLPFFKGENGFTGIGLAIVDRIIKLYDGSVKASGKPGACFEFSMKDR